MFLCNLSKEMWADKEVDSEGCSVITSLPICLWNVQCLHLL